MSIADHTAAERTGFPTPFEVTIPPDCEGWEEMYARHVVFGEARRAFEEGRFWFQDGLHAAEPGTRPSLMIGSTGEAYPAPGLMPSRARERRRWKGEKGRRGEDRGWRIEDGGWGRDGF